MKKKINFRIDPQVDTELREHAEEKGWSFSELLRWIIREYLGRIRGEAIPQNSDDVQT